MDPKSSSYLPLRGLYRQSPHMPRQLTADNTAAQAIFGEVVNSYLSQRLSRRITLQVYSDIRVGQTR